MDMPYTKAEYREMLQPMISHVAEQAQVTDAFLDRELYQIYMCTIWSQLTLNPGEAGLREEDLEPVHDTLNEAIAESLGTDHDLTACFRFVNSKAGEQAMARYQLAQTHKDLLLYFCSVILDPDGHRRWLEEQKEKLEKERPRFL
jgi:hypothetical protein